MITCTFDAKTYTREGLARLLEQAAECVREGETEVGGYASADFNLRVEEDE